MTGDAQGRFIDWYSDQSVVVVDLALACCAVETEFAVPTGAPRLTEVPDGARVVAVVSGTLTDALAGIVKEEIDNLPQPFVVSFGACACAGGPYWDAPSVTKGVDQLVRVDSWIAGCPPPPDALAGVVRQVRDARAVAG
ncbi:proton-conducting membrane transporter [Luteococcus sp. H138]|uniref:NADH-quinone oxidoreductase subunit B n=1 Tax=unclassified Luteococcus TaxID=2639923 RepID=UPI00313A948E